MEHLPKKYIKDESFDPIYSTVNTKFLLRSRIVPGMLVAFGFLILGTQVVMPLVSFKTQDEIASPVSSSVLGITSGFRDFEFKELGTPTVTTETATPEYFYLTIPKLGIENAIVKTNSTELNPEKTLGHYKGSKLPGVDGNTFIYGHSVLPWFFNPKNYKTIFSTLGDLETGDTVIVNYRRHQLTYKVETSRILKPEDVHPLESIKPEYLNTSTMVLMTCWPAGTKSKRLLVNLVLVD